MLTKHECNSTSGDKKEGCKRRAETKRVAPSWLALSPRSPTGAGAKHHGKLLQPECIDLFRMKSVHGRVCVFVRGPLCCNEESPVDICLETKDKSVKATFLSSWCSLLLSPVFCCVIRSHRKPLNFVQRRGASCLLLSSCLVLNVLQEQGSGVNSRSVAEVCCCQKIPSSASSRSWCK